MTDEDFYSPDELLAKKREFAAVLMKQPVYDITGAVRMGESRLTHQNYIARSNWHFDAQVNEFMKELRTDIGLAAIIPTKEEFAAKLYSDISGLRDAEVKLDYYKLFASIMGYIEKPNNPTGNTSVLVQQNVLVMPALQDDENYQAKIIEHQRSLVNE